MYAEALNEIGESEKAHQVLNRVRERAFGDSSERFRIHKQGIRITDDMHIDLTELNSR